MTAPRGVLIVEDEPMLREVAAEIVADAGFEAMTAETAEWALRMVAANAADISVVVTDVRLPGEIDGLELATRIRATWPSIRVIVVSGAPFEVPDGCRALAKPYRAAEFESVLQESA